MKLALALLVVAGCGKDPPATYTPARIVPLALPSIGLNLDAPDAAKIATAESASVEVDWPGVKLSVRIAEAELGAAAATAKGFARITKQESTTDGWELRYEETYAGETQHNVTIARTIGGIGVQCKGAGNSPAAEAQLAAACASLRK